MIRTVLMALAGVLVWLIAYAVTEIRVHAGITERTSA